MPILSLEPDLFPSDLFATGAQSSAPDRVWWILHAKPRQEKSLARQLHTSRIPFYLPLTPRRLLVRNRWLTSHIPLFPGYVFLFADQQERLASLATSRVVSTIRVSDQGQLHRDLLQVHLLIASGASVAAEERLLPGSFVEIQSGPLAGLRGKIVQEASRRRFIVEVDFIQRGASVLLEGSSLLPVNDHPCS